MHGTKCAGFVHFGSDRCIKPHNRYFNQTLNFTISSCLFQSSAQFPTANADLISTAHSRVLCKCNQVFFLSLNEFLKVTHAVAMYPVVFIGQ